MGAGVQICEKFQRWLENPNGATHTALIHEMQAFDNRLDKAGREREHYDDDGSEYGYYVHPELRSLLLAMSGVREPVAA